MLARPRRHDRAPNLTAPMTDRRSVTSALCQKQTLRQTAISRDELVHSTDDSYGQWFRTSAHGNLAQRKATHFDPSSCGDDFGHDVRFWGVKRTSVDKADIGIPCFRHTLPLTILLYSPLLASLADSEGLLQVRLTVRSQQSPQCGRHQRVSEVSASVAVAEPLEALA